MTVPPSDLEFAQQPGDILDAIFVAPGHCFRMTQSEDRRANHCGEPVVWKGPWSDVSGVVWTVEACALHKLVD